MTRFQDTWSKTDIETTYDLQNLELSRIIQFITSTANLLKATSLAGGNKTYFTICIIFNLASNWSVLDNLILGFDISAVL